MFQEAALHELLLLDRQRFSARVKLACLRSALVAGCGTLRTAGARACVSNGSGLWFQLTGVERQADRSGAASEDNRETARRVSGSREN